MAQEFSQQPDQRKDVLNFRHSKLNLPKDVQDAFQLADGVTDGGFFLIGSGARKCIMGEPETIGEFDFLGDFDLDRLQRSFGDHFIRRWDQFKTVKIGWRGREIDFISRKDIITALDGSDITLSLMCVDKEGVVYDPLDCYEDLEKKQIKIRDADNKISIGPDRVLRILRFAADLGFDVEADTKRACISNAPLMDAENTEYALKQFLKAKPDIRNRALQIAQDYGICNLVKGVIMDKSELDIQEDPVFNASRGMLEQFLGIRDFFVFGGSLRDIILKRPIRDFDAKFENKTAGLDDIVDIISSKGLVRTNDVQLPDGTYYMNTNFNVISFHLNGVLFDLSFTDVFDPNKFRRESDVNLNAMAFDNKNNTLLNKDLSFDVATGRLELCDPTDPNIDPLKVINALKQISRIEGLQVDTPSLETIKAQVPRLVTYFQERPYMLYKLYSLKHNPYTDDITTLIRSCSGGVILLQLLGS